VLYGIRVSLLISKDSMGQALSSENKDFERRASKTGLDII
jgi:hypothetical protein